MLEKAGMVYQPYNSSGRVPTVQGLTTYIENYLVAQEDEKQDEVIKVRSGLKQLVESIGALADGVVVGFLRNDEYYYL
jgi:transcriptional regulator of heat shock response